MCKHILGIAIQLDLNRHRVVLGAINKEGENSGVYKIMIWGVMNILAVSLS